MTPEQRAREMQRRMTAALSSGEHDQDWFRLTAEASTRTATVHVYDVIGAYWGTDATELVRQLRDLDVDELTVHINSPGGAAFDGIAIANALRAHKARVVTVVDGLAASAASIIAVAGDEVVMGRGAELMIHDAAGLCWGQAADMQQMVGLLDKLSDSYASLYADRAGGTAAEWREVMRAETWYSATEAVAAGLADRVAPKRGDTEDDAPAATARFDLSLFAHAGRQQAPAPRIPASAGPPQTPVDSGGSTTTQERSLPVAFTQEQLTTMRQELGLSEAADEATIVAALQESLREQAEPAAPAVLPEGVVAIERTQLDAMRTSLEQLTAEAVQRRDDRRTQLVAAAVADGRIAPARRDHWTAALKADPEGMETALAALAPGLIPVAELGHGSGDSPEGTTDLSDTDLDELAALAGLPKGALR